MDDSGQRSEDQNADKDANSMRHEVSVGKRAQLKIGLGIICVAFQQRDLSIFCPCPKILYEV